MGKVEPDLIEHIRGMQARIAALEDALAERDGYEPPRIPYFDAMGRLHELEKAGVPVGEAA